MISFRWEDGLKAWLCIAPVLKDCKCRFPASLHLFLFSPSCRTLLSLSLSLSSPSFTASPGFAGNCCGSSPPPCLRRRTCSPTFRATELSGIDFPDDTQRTCILACQPISAAAEPDVCLWDPILVPLEHNNVQFYRLSFNIYTDGRKRENYL